jgi:hypothetical protein
VMLGNTQIGRKQLRVEQQHKTEHRLCSKS